MNHRDRVITALNHEQPDRCPMQMSFTPEFAKRLENDLQLKKTRHNPHGKGNKYEIEINLDQDMLLTSVGWANSYYQESDEYIDEWGIKWKTVEYNTKFGKGKYTEIVDHPLKNDQDIDSYRAPDPMRDVLYIDAEKLLQQYRDEYWIVGVTVTTIFETAWALRGLERLLMDFAIQPELAEKIINIPFTYHLAAAKKLVELGVDMIWTGDDIGTQQSMIMSPNMWRSFLKPKMADFIAQLKKINKKIKIAYHSDGFIYPIIPDLIEIGVDVLNPVQPACLDPACLKKEFGDKLCFWGTIDEQHTLPFGTPGDVKAEVIKRLNTIGKNGGLIIGPTHHVQLDTPLENFWAMVNTILHTPYSETG